MEKAGFWWCSMPMKERLNYPSFVANQTYIESKWSKQWGDRLNELVFIGQHMNKENISSNLEKCLLNDDEIISFQNKKVFKDPFP